MSFIDKYYAIFNNSVGQHSVTISRAEFANLLGVFSKQEQQLDRLKAENDGLKKQLQFEFDETLLQYSNELERLKTENEHLAEKEKEVRHYLKEAYKYRKTLTEIKEIAITGLEGFCPKCSRKECEDNNCIETAIRDILQKISECEGNDV